MESSDKEQIIRIGTGGKTPKENGVRLQEDLEVLSSRYGITLDLEQTLSRKRDKLGFARYAVYILSLTRVHLYLLGQLEKS